VHRSRVIGHDRAETRTRVSVNAKNIQYKFIKPYNYSEVVLRSILFVQGVY